MRVVLRASGAGDQRTGGEGIGPIMPEGGRMLGAMLTVALAALLAGGCRAAAAR